ncbi:hypothetical protein B0H13DRAFT_2379703 [Mycena leptocephala]|nr:hypothetical protein B0H13DRAFT_2379703 [Mycena leptocephala]
MDHLSRADAEYLFPLCLDISRSTTPLYSLTLPISFPPLELLNSILSLFPELREFSMKITDRVFPAPGSVFIWPRPSTAVPSMDTRSLDLNDEHAFEERPADDISDTEEDELDRHTRRWQARNVLRWIYERQLSLPPNTEVLRLGVNGSPEYQLGAEEEHVAVASLADLHPLLREVDFGSGSGGWRRIGDVWKWKAVGE